MPRNISKVMQRVPGTTAIPGDTISAAPYEATINDIIDDLNNPRPISAGGTGAVTAANARAALGIVAFDGSSYALLSGATFTGPVSATSGTFSGVVSGTSGAFTDVVSGANATVDWHLLNRITADGRYAQLNNSIFTGTVGVSVPVGTFALFAARAGSLDRWQWGRDASAAETGFNAGSNFSLYRYADSGSFIGTPLQISRATGVANFETTPTVAGNTVWHAGNLTTTTWIQTAVAPTTSGVAVDITGLPANTLEIQIILENVSFNNTDTNFIGVQLGTSSGMDGAGYAGAGRRDGYDRNGGTNNFGNFQSGTGAAYLMGDVGNTTSAIGVSGIVEMFRFTATNHWFMRSDLGIQGAAAGQKSTFSAINTKTLSGVLDRVRIMRTLGTGTFDAGLFYVRYRS